VGLRDRKGARDGIEKGSRGKTLTYALRSLVSQKIEKQKKGKRKGKEGAAIRYRGGGGSAAGGGSGGS